MISLQPLLNPRKIDLNTICYDVFFFQPLPDNKTAALFLGGIYYPPDFFI